MSLQLPPVLSLSPYSVFVAIPAMRQHMLSEISFFHMWRDDDGVMGCLAESSEIAAFRVLHDLGGMAAAW